jgi:hypothetical protein
MPPYLVRRGSPFEECFQPEPNSGCWLWLGGVQSMGYGMLGPKKHRVLATRFSYEKYKGPIPIGLSVLHRCDTPLCVNPDHLFAGTQRDNLRDAAQKGRTVHGEQHPGAKLTNQQVVEIRALLGQGVSQRLVALRFEVNPSTISRIAGGLRRKAA